MLLFTAKNQQHKVEYSGGCLCGEISFIARGEPANPHLCSCTMCRKSSGAPTVAWVEFPRKIFQWSRHGKLGLYRSSEKTQRLFCQSWGGFLGAINDGDKNIFITIASLKNPELIIPGQQHSYKEKIPSWWKVEISRDNIS